MKNQNVAFMLKRKELHKARTEAERLAILRELVELDPKGGQDLKLRAKYKKELEVLMRKSSSRGGIVSDNPYAGIKYNRQLVLVGETNSGRSSLLRLLTGADVSISDRLFTTYKPKTGMFVYNDIPIQVVEVPPVYLGDNDSNKYSFIRNSDVICITARNQDEARAVQSILENQLIIASGEVRKPGEHKYRPKDEILEKPSFIAAWNFFEREGIKIVDINSIGDIGRELYRLLSIQRLYYFDGKQVDGEPLVFPLDQQVSVQNFADRIGIRRFKGAKIYSSQKLFKGIACKTNIVGIDCVEANPVYDKSQMSNIYITRLLLGLIGELR